MSARGVGGYLRPALPMALALGAGLALRLWMLGKLFDINGDMLIYGDLAKNLLLHGQYALTPPGGAIYSTLIRLPGYPLFLALCFKIFGMENYFAAACVQIALDLLGCLLLAGFVRRIVPRRGQAAALITLWLAALCPFTASYTVATLAETPTLFMLALAMWAMARFHDEPRWVNALWFTFAVTGAALLRPDGALAAVAFAPALLIGIGRRCRRTRGLPQSGAGLETHTTAGQETGATSRSPKTGATSMARMAVVCVLLALAPFSVWTARNWRVFHVIEPLAPRLATDPGESTNPGWQRWVKSWCLDFISTYEIYWNVPGDRLDVSELPNRAFDTPTEYAETAALAEDYNSHGYQLSPEIDAGFERLAEKHIAAHRLGYYVGLPLGRVADMWLRPRVENLNIDLDWWVYEHHNSETEFSWAYAGLNALYLLLAIVGLSVRPRFWGALLAYLLLRSLLLGTVEAPETRYTLECFPMLFVLGGVAIARLMDRSYLSKSKAVLGRG
ncbi:MAG: glycosyltransferase family 39 protein [Terracidiphilus sp.]|nr:glycosyltransferase family 39 protein [Terracidiphilus sp.]